MANITINGIATISTEVQAAIDASTALAVLLAGRAGGQTIYGGTAASDSLTLISTSNATKGSVIIGASNQIVVTTSGVQFGNATAATHPATFPVSSTGIAFYNTADQTTNYERYVFNWSSNVFQIKEEFGGTANTARVLRILQGSTSNLQVDFNASASSPTGFVNIARSTSAAGSTHLSTSGTSTASSGITVGVGIILSVNHSSTAGYTGLLINITETAIGSGNRRLINAQTGGVDKFIVDRDGSVWSANETIVTTQFDKTDATLADVTGLTANVLAGKTYQFEGVLFTTSNIGGGVKSAIGGTATATSIIYEGDTTALGSITQSRASSLGSPVGGVTAVTAARIDVKGTIVVNAAGTLTLQFAENAAVSTSSVLVGSYFKVKRIG